MASKASMLKQGANKTGKGLFAGMSRLDSREEETQKEVKVTNVIKETAKKEEIVTKPVREKTEETKPVDEEEIVVEEVQEEVEEELEKVQNTESADTEEIAPGQEITQDIKSADKVVKDTINKAVEAPKKLQKTSEKPNSRYEKEKFLLLDIRGYRDYVEHMAKAANMSATKYIRNLIQQDMDKNIDIYEAHKALEEKLKGRVGN